MNKVKSEAPCGFEWQGQSCGMTLDSSRHTCYDTEKRPKGPNALCAFNVGHPNMACHQFIVEKAKRESCSL